jgi:formate-dependent nitrite reductase membrane component NrfD
MSPIRNERVTLTAAAIKAAATSPFTVGVLGLIAAVFYDIGTSAKLPLVTIVIGAAIWLAAAVMLHLAARWTLRGLRE